jgi:hypothetical protein
MSRNMQLIAATSLSRKKWAKIWQVLGLAGRCALIDSNSPEVLELPPCDLLLHRGSKKTSAQCHGTTEEPGQIVDFEQYLSAPWKRLPARQSAPG